MKEIIIEIRDAEGGEDAKLLVKDMADIYLKWANNNQVESKVLESREGFVSIWLKGYDVKSVFENEVGNHRWQRVSPTERRGRVHTSSITVSVLDKSDFEKRSVNINEKDVDVKYTRGSGNGGQNRNRRETVVVLTHRPTGIVVRSESQRTQHQNEQIAWELLKSKLQVIQDSNKETSLRNKRVTQTDRSDKRRTYRLQDGFVIDHITNKRIDSKQILKGRIELLH